MSDAHDTELVPVEPTETALAPTFNPQSEIGQLLHLAINQKVDVGILERLAAMKERFEDRSARNEFNKAMAAFSDECPSVLRTRTATVTSDKGGQFSYRFADLETIVKTIRPFLVKHGLSFKHDSKPAGAGMLDVICTVQHIAGHSESATFPCPTTSRAGMSDAQKYASALTFARRQSLIQVLGLTLTDNDTDADETEKISEEQARTLEEWIVSAGADRARWLRFMGVEKISDLAASRYDDAIQSLRDKKDGKKGGKS